MITGLDSLKVITKVTWQCGYVIGGRLSQIYLRVNIGNWYRVRWILTSEI